MGSFIDVGPNGTVWIFGVKLVGANAENGVKLLVSIGLVAAMALVGWLLRRLLRSLPLAGSVRASFWARQGVNLLLAFLTLVGLTSIWFDDPARLSTALGLFSAGLAFALQKVVTSMAGYFVILRGRTFNVGDRIVMGGVRGDVVGLAFTQTTIMEMGQPPGVQSDEPAMWVKSRQYTGRIVTVPNSKIFDEPVYNYTREFELIWEDLSVPVPYDSDATHAERVLLDAARRHQAPVDRLTTEELEGLRRRYAVIRPAELEPRVYQRLTDSWLELTVRFLTYAHGVREVKDAMTREILAGLDAAGIHVASATVELVGLPPLRLAEERWEPRPRRGGQPHHD